MKAGFCWHTWQLLFCATRSSKVRITVPRRSFYSLKMSHVQLVDIEKYLKDVMESTDPSFQLAASDKHRKGMMRGLLEISKIEMDEELRNLSSTLEWEKAERFLQEELKNMEPLDDAPQLQYGIENYQKFAPDSAKLFSFCARGRTYKGKFDQLLQDVRPDLSSYYQEVANPISEAELLTFYALEQEPVQQELLLECVKKSLSSFSPESPDSGKRNGAKSEANLQDFLTNECTEERVLYNVFITTKHKNSISKKCPYAIQLPKSVDVDGMTTELDAVVFAPINPGDTAATLEAVWEAKATLHPGTLYDALSKKCKAVSVICAQDDAKLLIGGEEYTLQSTEQPGIGIFGSKMLPPHVAARRIQVLIGEDMLSSSPEAVKEVLETGKVTVSQGRLLNFLNETLRLAQEIRPKVHLPSRD